MSKCPICGGDSCQVNNAFVCCVNAHSKTKVPGYQMAHADVRGRGWVWEPLDFVRSRTAIAERNGHVDKGDEFELIGPSEQILKEIDDVVSTLATIEDKLLKEEDQSEIKKLKAEKLKGKNRKSVLNERLKICRTDQTNKRIKARLEHEVRQDEERDKRTPFEKDYDSVSDYLSDRLKFNKLTMKIEIDDIPVDLDETRAELARMTGFKAWHTSDQSVLSIVKDFAKQNSYCPIENYLTKCHQDIPTPHSFLDNLANHLFGTRSIVQNMYFKATLIGAVRRIYQPGCEHPYMMILYSEDQGIGKSNSLKMLFGESFFGEGQIQMGDTDSILSMSQSWAFEIPECDEIFRTRSSSQLKSFITITNDTYRPPYGRSASKHPRRTLLFGTTNHREFLSDSTGNRRFAVIEIPLGFNVRLETIAELRDKIWASAMDGFLEGVPNKLPESLYGEAKEEVKDFLKVSHWQEVIETYMKDKKVATMDQLLELALKKHPGEWKKTDKDEVSGVMAQLGYEYKQQRDDDGVRRRYFKQRIPWDELAYIDESPAA